MSRLRVAIAGGSGYTGGELLRLLLFHPRVELKQVVSSSHAGQYVYSVHPNLRKLSSLRFCRPDDLTSCDILFLCLPHGVSAREIERFQGIAPRIIDLSADFRLRSASLYEQWYDEPHGASHLLAEAVYGLPELNRAELPSATLVSGGRDTRRREPSSRQKRCSALISTNRASPYSGTDARTWASCGRG